MWEKLFLLLLHSVEAAVASPCWQGATFSASVVSPAVESSGILRVPGVASLPQCVAAGCDLPGYDLAWLFEGRCYVLSCQQRENCRPRERPGADSVLAFLRRASPQTLVLQSLVRGAPYGGRWRPLSRSSEAPGDLEALKDLALFDEPRQDLSDPGMLDVEYSEESQEERGDGGPQTGSDESVLKGRDGFNKFETADGLGRGSVAPTAAFSVGNVSLGDEERTGRPTDPAAAGEPSSSDPQSPSSQTPAADSTRAENRTLALASVTPKPAGALLVSPGNPAALTSPTPDAGRLLKSAAEASSSSIRAGTVTSDPSSIPAVTVTSDPSSIPAVTVTSDPSSIPAVTVTSDPSSIAAAANTPSVTTASRSRGSNRGPLAIVGPDRTLFLPVSSVLLDGGSSTDDRGVVSYRWDTISGPPGIKLEGADRAVAAATGLRVGRYVFRLTVSDEEGATDSATVTVRVQEARSLPPVAHASGSHTLTLPNSSLVLRGSVTDGDQTEVRYLWSRDSQSPAAGDVLYGSDTQASLYLANLVEGTYLFQLRVTDAQGRSSTSTATVEVRPEPGGEEELELEMMVSVSQVSVAQRDTVVRQLAALLHVLDGDIQLRALRGHSHLSTVLRFSVRGPSGPLSGSRLVSLLRNQLLREKSDYLLFRVLRVDTVFCLLRCSGRGQCDPITKECSCDPFWTENLIRRYLGDGESNCEWRVLYVVLTSFVLMVFILAVSWTFICCFKRRKQTKVRKKTKYTILDNMDEQERMELRPKFNIKHRSTDHNSSLMMSESELDSDQDAIFSRDRPVRSRIRLSAQAAHNGHAYG